MYFEFPACTVGLTRSLHLVVFETLAAVCAAAGPVASPASNVVTRRMTMSTEKSLRASILMTKRSYFSSAHKDIRFIPFFVANKRGAGLEAGRIGLLSWVAIRVARLGAVLKPLCVLC